MPETFQILVQFYLLPVQGSVFLCVAINDSYSEYEQPVSKELTNKEATIAGLRACGWVEEVGRSSKYLVYQVEGNTGVPRNRWLVGGSGALRYIPFQCSAISQSKTNTNSIEHRAFRYVGRIANVTKDGLTVEQYQNIWRSVVAKEINVTKDGYYNPMKEAV